MKHPTLAEKYRATQARITFEQLLALDDIWTLHLHTASKITPEDIEVFHSLTNEMYALLDKTAREAMFLQELIGLNAEFFETGFSKALETIPLEDAIREKVKAKVYSSGGFVTILEASLKEVIDKAPADKLEIEAKMKTISDGQYTKGDITFRCALLAAGIGACLGAGVWAGAAGIFAHSVSNGCWG